MERVKVKAFVPQEIAILAGRTCYGDKVYEPSDTEIQQLSADERLFLIHDVDTLILDGPDWTWEAMCTALRRQRAEAEERRETAIQEMLARSDEEWIETRPCRLKIPADDGNMTVVEYDEPVLARGLGGEEPEYLDDPRIAKRWEHISQEIARQRAEVESLVRLRASCSVTLPEPSPAAESG